ncbi:La-related protein 6 like protein [Argiope bruennichi]|uniref:La-related protein 6 like protein n=1 Tax=Argiope bruennichi TaxID=94029 RepID=A0A8T0FW42_ARGBR|nr:La-related protein 6 like protein [Argiope bruennichi]
MVLTNEKRRENFGNDKEDEGLNNENGDEEITKQIKDTEVIIKKEEEEISNGKEDTGHTVEKENAELTVEKGRINSTCEKDSTENNKIEIFKENRKIDNKVLKQDALDHDKGNESSDMEKVECVKREIVISAECGSDSKISTSSTEKGSSSYSGSKSGIRIDDQNLKESFKIPNDALVAKIVRQAEFYFSDFNLLKNNFLLKHVRRNKEGYVSLKLVASFRKLKSLTKDWRIVAYSLQSSKILELNSEKTKIRRIEPIPKIEETSLGKTVIVFNLPFQNPTSEELKEMFSKFGNIVHAEIMGPKSENYNTYHKRCKYHNEEIASTIFGCIEFEKFEDALSAIKDEESHLPKENKMKVVALMPHVQRPRRRNSRFNQYNQYPRRGNGRFKPRYEFQNDQMVSNIPFDDYRYVRPMLNEKQYRRYYRGTYPKSVHSSSSTSEIPDKLHRDNYVVSGEDLRNNTFTRSRQLKMSNRMNINRQFTTRQPRYVDEQFGYREINFEG